MTASTLSVALRANDLTLRYGRTTALDGVSLTLGTGVTGLLGPNGAGKTTLLRIVATAVNPDAGELSIYGHDPLTAPGRLAARRRLGYLPQDPGFHPSFTAFEFVDYVGILKELTDRRARHAEVRRVLDAVGLAVALTVGGVAVQVPENTAVLRARAAAVTDPAPLHTCRTVDGATYCAFDGFDAWIDAWAEVVRSVRRPMPDATVAGPPLAVRQRIPADGEWRGRASSLEEEQAVAARRRQADRDAGMPEAVPVGTDWSTRAAASFAAAIAYRLVAGLSPDTGELTVCGARGALVIWLVGQVGGRVADGLREADKSSWGALVLTDPVLTGNRVSVEDTDAASGLALLKRPVGEATALVRRHWAELTDPATGVDRFAALLGVPAAPLPPVEERSVRCRR